MKEVTDLTFCVVTCGLFMPMADRLAEDAKRVLLWNPDTREFPSIKQRCIGDGIDKVERVDEFWPHLNDIDCFCFPDVMLPGLQAYLESINKPVWGSKGGVVYETGRERFMDLLGEIGLDVPPHVVVTGLTELSDYLKDKEDKFIKVSRYRGDMDTKHWRNDAMDCTWLCKMRVKFGPYGDYIRFLVFDKIDTPLEIGGDTYNVNGQWPSMMLNGIEGKDKCYLSAVTKVTDMPEQIQRILEVFGPEMAKTGYSNQMSFEVRVAEDKAYWIDATQRGGMPSTASQHKLMRNFTEVVWAGANGELLEPDYQNSFSIECIITAKPDCESWTEVEIPESIKPWCRFSNCCCVDGVYGFPPTEHSEGDLGWLVAVGNTPREVLDNAKAIADELPDGLNADVESISSIIKEVEEMEKESIPFTDKPMPEPAEALD